MQGIVFTCKPAPVGLNFYLRLEKDKDKPLSIDSGLLLLIKKGLLDAQKKTGEIF